MNRIFDPFNDRLARDIRNSLSSALISELTGDRAGAVLQTADQWERKGLSPVYREYIRETRGRYLQVGNDIHKSGIQAPRLQAVLLWNAGLFFEVHELLETLWHLARNTEHTALKGFIQAAGVYVHSLRGKPQAAVALAAKARRNIMAGREALGFIANLDGLIKALEEPSRQPPSLVLSQPFP